MFIPNPGEMIQFDFCIFFQMGWWKTTNYIDKLRWYPQTSIEWKVEPPEGHKMLLILNSPENSQNQQSSCEKKWYTPGI